MSMFQDLTAGPGRLLETTPASSLNGSPPISTLNKQSSPPLGQRLVLGIQVGASCFPEGGVEAILRRYGSGGTGGGTGGGSEVMTASAGGYGGYGGGGSFGATTTTPAAASSATAAAGIHDGLASVSLEGGGNKNNNNNNADNADDEEDDGFDAFNFLHGEDDRDNNGSSSSRAPSSNGRSSSSNATKPPGRMLGGFLKKVAATTSAQLGRSMQGLAVRIDQGRNPDLVRVAMYDPSTLELLGVTEPYPVPRRQQSSDDAAGDAADAANNSNGGGNVRFEVPLVVPGSMRQRQVLLKLWIQSGAALLQSTKVAKNYLLGSAVVDCMGLVVPGVTAIPLANPLAGMPAVGPGGGQRQQQQQQPQPQLQVCAVPDPKFSQVLTRGWSLTDPDMSAYSSGLCHLPLDQAYVFPGRVPHHWLVAVERAAETAVTLPLATAVMEMAAKACGTSLSHAKSVSALLRNNRHDHKDTDRKATVHLGLVGVVVVGAGASAATTTTTSSATVSVAWRRPDSIFELELAANEALPVCRPDVAAGFGTVRRTFHPRLCTEASAALPGVLQSCGGTMPAGGFLLGALYFCVTVVTNGTGQEAQVELWETVLGLESFVGGANGGGGGGGGGGANRTIQVPLRRHRDPTGHLLLQIEVILPDEMVNRQQQQQQGGGGALQQQQQRPNTDYNMRTVPATDGLVSMVGMDSLADGVNPHLDSMPSFPPGAGGAAPSLRDQQLNTMGYFVTTQYMDQHLALRQSALESFQDRARRYRQALTQPEQVEPHLLRTPKNFRPSSSRPAALLSGLPFNVHVASLNVSVMDAARPKPVATAEYPGASFHNVTCGAPADHARGFGNVLGNVSNLVVSGGLRRLEARRVDCAAMLRQAQEALIAGVGTYLVAARRAGPNVNHVPSRHAEVQHLRWRVFECVHNLHHVTWMCAVRRANVFSQALGLAVSSYLASLSDANRCAAGWPSLWRTHGFMVCFEGLLSAAGKELGMIEDASVAVAMLRMVRVVLMPDNGIPSRAVYVPSSPYLKWVSIFPSGQGSGRHFLVQVGVDPAYYAERVPPPLQNGAAVQLYPVLYQVGVDIRQWGANTGANLVKNGQKQQEQVTTCGLIDDDDDDVGVVDSDVLVALNYEALRKMNCYAHAISPQDILLDRVQADMAFVFAPKNTPEGANQDAARDPLPVHPSLSSLHSHILSSAGRMNHSILDEAATIAQQLGGGGVVFCKSGKDRTAMHVTYKQAQFAARYRDNNNMQAILRDATLMRLHGTRLPICEKNVGQALYAFNSLQTKFMPDALKPPMGTLAGFLKGGEIFKSGGGIES